MTLFVKLKVIVSNLLNIIYGHKANTICGSHRLVDSIVEVGVRVLFFQEGHIELANIYPALVQMSLNILRCTIFLPVINFESLLLLVVLVFVPENPICCLDPTNNSNGEADVCCDRSVNCTAHN